MCRKSRYRMLLGCLLFVAGCAAYSDKVKVEKEFDMDGKTVAVIPFQDPKYDYFKSPIGNRIAERVTITLTNHAGKDCTPMASRDIRTIAENIAMEEIDWRFVGLQLDVDYLLLGQIRRFELKPKNNLNVYYGTMVGKFELIDVQDDAQVVWEKVITAHFPERQKYAQGIDVFSITPEEMLDKLILVSAGAISQRFYDHYEER